LIAFRQRSHALKSLPQSPPLRVFLPVLDLRGLQAEQFIGSDSERADQSNNEIRSGQLPFRLVIGNDPLGGSPAAIRTDAGKVAAEKLVIAANAWSAGIRELSRAIAAISSDMIVTAPIPEQLQQIGWHNDLSITDSQTMVDYYRITRDGRVAFGKGGWTIAYGGNIGGKFERHARRAAEVTADFRRCYLSLKDVAVTHGWSGPIDRTPDSLPLLGCFFRTQKHLLWDRLEWEWRGAERDRRKNFGKPRAGKKG
jgi:hypothetical protein